MEKPRFERNIESPFKDIHDRVICLSDVLADDFGEFYLCQKDTAGWYFIGTNGGQRYDKPLPAWKIVIYDMEEIK